MCGHAAAVTGPQAGPPVCNTLSSQVKSLYDQPDSPRGRFHVEAEIVSEDDTAHQHLLAKANHALAGYLAHASTCLDE